MYFVTELKRKYDDPHYPLAVLIGANNASDPGVTLGRTYGKYFHRVITNGSEAIIIDFFNTIFFNNNIPNSTVKLGNYVPFLTYENLNNGVVSSSTINDFYHFAFRPLKPEELKLK